MGWVWGGFGRGGLGWDRGLGRGGPDLLAVLGLGLVEGEVEQGAADLQRKGVC